MPADKPDIHKISEYLKNNGVENNLNLNQPWVLWRHKCSQISLSELNTIMQYLDKEKQE